MMDRRGFLVGLGGAAAAMVGTGAVAQTVGALAPLASAAPRRRPPAPAAQLIEAARLNGQVAFVALGPDGTVLDAREPDAALPPASTLKAVTALYALDRLGADHRFTTRVWVDGDTLILAGGGDPVLDSDALDGLAADTAAALQGRSFSRFAVWGGALPRIDEIAPPQADHLAYNPSVSGMMLNFNRVHLNWRAGGAGLSLTARGSRVAPRAYSVRIAAVDRAAPLFAYEGGPVESWTIAARAMGRSGTRWLPVRQPELYAGDVFQTLCRARGLVLPTPEVAMAAPRGVEIARIDSPPLRGILRDMLHYSTNLTAEAVGLASSGAGDLASSGAVMTAWMQAQGIAGAFRFADHSGLSPASRISPATLAHLLHGPGRMAGLPALLKPDPLADALGSESRGRDVRAKTGTLNFVSNLAGHAPGGITFAILTAQPDRHAATIGADLPEGVLAWTGRSKRMQRDLIERFTRLPGEPVRQMTAQEILDDPRG
ncbi:D-alanyl-D-alanine carboxypeptidase [Paracoccus sp. Z118]|uniref:D-alanyl-D-alanine carboxypeptidase n=1 Tax=Paracoccus sp. Z118 TaxID=2851017 RepID=UPI0020B794D6|nr:D-alanyl-D-alanine carboxypeptidase [Paracoccus sp. Z118]